MVRIRLRNTGSQPRRLSATFYAEWVLGSLRDQACLHVVCSADAETGALFATSAWAGDFAGKVAFAAVAAIRVDTAPHSFTTDRAEFLGREGSRKRPPPSAGRGSPAAPVSWSTRAPR
jgi:cellobiose phosphorylase